jgi:hypothetical protein
VFWFGFFFFIMCPPCCQFLWIVLFWLPHWYSLDIYSTKALKSHLIFFFQYHIILFEVQEIHKLIWCFFKYIRNQNRII